MAQRLMVVFSLVCALASAGALVTAVTSSRQYTCSAWHLDANGDPVLPSR